MDKAAVSSGTVSQKGGERERERDKGQRRMSKRRVGKIRDERCVRD